MGFSVFLTSGCQITYIANIGKLWNNLKKKVEFSANPSGREVKRNSKAYKFLLQIIIPQKQKVDKKIVLVKIKTSYRVHIGLK